MRVVVQQPGYLPWNGFFDQLARCEQIVVYDDVGYDKNGWRNRNRIKTRDGVRWLTVPVLLGEHEGQPQIRDVRIDNRGPWARKHLETIRQSYSKTPYFEPLFGQLSEVLLRPWERLVDLDLAAIKLLRDALGIRTPMACSSALGIGGDRVGRLVSICQHFGADSYMSGNAAQDYLDEAQFAAAGIEVVWQDYTPPTYPQPHGEFVPYMSVLDLLFSCGPESLAILKKHEPTPQRC